ncbi:helix-turn-helix domain-containing protein [Bacillus sp. B-jedd]|uniref:helix-turn-helix domain-containing protein n=1 Tax=Bacillus sp. B-jedd TaxID=1476857 RepID=UPI000515581C|nr:helix-turn-helix transcriptional regulator [Bacillus sp. B-jedd]CEG29423.1 transcriptional regulator/TPR domain protein [Bacillus sp. B-jedd]
MNEGKVIKFYREKANLTQEQLSKGICSVTHISKIERGLTEYSSEITDLLAQRLGVDIQSELKHLNEIEAQIHLLENALIKQKYDEVETIIQKLLNFPILVVSEFQIRFELLLARYYCSQGHPRKATKILSAIQKDTSKLSLYESYLLNHVLGYYYITEKKYINAIDVLKSINPMQYRNHEFYYILAYSYHSIDSKVLAYYYAEKALTYFKETNNFNRIIDTETLMIVQIGDNEYLNFQETAAQYQTLLQTCDICNFIDKKSKLLYNFAYNRYLRKEYMEASALYKEAMQICEKNSPLYFWSYEGFIRSSYEGDLLEKERLLELVADGMSLLANNPTDRLSQILFTMLNYELTHHNELYTFIDEIALPYFKENELFWFVQQYEKRLFVHYSESNQAEKALAVAAAILKV